MAAELDRTARLMKKQEALLAEEARVLRLLKIADPTEEALRKWEAKSKSLNVEQTGSNASIVASRAVRVAGSRPKEKAKMAEGKAALQQELSEVVEERSKGATEQSKHGQFEMDAKLKDPNENLTTEIKPLEAPLWLGAPQPKEASDTVKVAVEDAGVSEDFLEYKDRLKGNAKPRTETLVPSEPSGLVLLRPSVADKVPESREVIDEEAQDAAAADAVALLLRHKSGLASAVASEEKGSGRETSRKKRKVKKGRFAEDGEVDYEAWVPPRGSLDKLITLSKQLSVRIALC